MENIAIINSPDVQAPNAGKIWGTVMRLFLYFEEPGGRFSEWGHEQGASCFSMLLLDFS
jgi:hypothetical protein